MPETTSEIYQHPTTFVQSGDLGVDFRAAVEEYDFNLTQHLPLDKNASILDVGCGWGQFLYWLRGHGYANTQGIDLGAEQERHCRSLGLSVTRVADSREFLEAQPGEYDLVTLHHVIEHMDADEGLRLLRAMYRSLKPSGRVIIQTPNMNSLGAHQLRYIELTHVTGYTESNLHQLLSLAGFAPVHVFGNRTPRIFTPHRLIFLLMQSCARLIWRAMLYAELGTDAPHHVEKNLYAVGQKES